jgi:hypothetical protein
MKILMMVILLFALLIVLPAGFSEIQIILPDENLYNLGDGILPQISIKAPGNHYGFFKMRIFCDNSELQYYTAPLNVEADFRTQVIVPELQLTDTTLGKCNLRADYDAADGSRIDSSSSVDFFVEEDLSISINENLESKPGVYLEIFGEVKKYNNKPLSSGEAIIKFGTNEEKADIEFGILSHKIILPENAASGNMPGMVSVADKFGNYADKTFSIYILAVPSRIENLFDKKFLDPGETGRSRITLLDHNEIPINGTSINVKILNTGEEAIAEEDVDNQDLFVFELSSDQKPGEYFLLSTFENIKEQSSFIVNALEKIVMNQESGIVTVENVGNMAYDDEVTIVAESLEGNYLVNKKIKLNPGEIMIIDLSNEVPQGTYSIILPDGLTSGDLEETNEEISEKVFNGIEIEDNRNIFKKSADGMSAITAAVAGAAGYVASRPLLASTILVFIILATVMHYSWGFIKRKVKGDAPAKTDHLFEDYEYGQSSSKVKPNHDKFEDKNENNKPGD